MKHLLVKSDTRPTAEEALTHKWMMEDKVKEVNTQKVGDVLKNL